MPGSLRVYILIIRDITDDAEVELLIYLGLQKFEKKIAGIGRWINCDGIALKKNVFGNVLDFAMSTFMSSC